MKRTTATPLLGLGLAGLVIGFLLETAVASSGSPLLVPPPSFPITLVVVAAIVVGFAVPIARATRGLSSKRINPFAAMRIAVLAKACGLSGALVTGGTLGLLIYLLTRSIVPGGGALPFTIMSAVGGVILLAGGLVAEHLCTLPPDDGDGERGHV